MARQGTRRATKTLVECEFDLPEVGDDATVKIKIAGPLSAAVLAGLLSDFRDGYAEALVEQMTARSDGAGVNLFGEQQALPRADISPQSYRARQRDRLAVGLHPMTGLPLARNGKTCRTCGHHWVRRMGGVYHKCALVEMTGGPGTDIRVGWPACQAYEEEDGHE